MDDLSRFCCHNPDRPLSGRRAQGNLIVCARYGAAGQHRLPDCRACTYRFPQHERTPPFNGRLPHDQPLAVLSHLADGCGACQSARLVGVGKNALGRLAQAAGEHARRLHDERVTFSPDTRGVQLDEKWSFVGRKQKHGDAVAAADAGDGSGAGRSCAVPGGMGDLTCRSTLKGRHRNDQGWQKRCQQPFPPGPLIASAIINWPPRSCVFGRMATTALPIVRCFLTCKRWFTRSVQAR